MILVVTHAGDPGSCNEDVQRAIGKAQLVDKNAVKAGCRLFDTAAAYFDEEAVRAAISEAIQEGLVTREELFITTKVWIDHFSYEKTK